MQVLDLLINYVGSHTIITSSVYVCSYHTLTPHTVWLRHSRIGTAYWHLLQCQPDTHCVSTAHALSIGNNKSRSKTRRRWGACGTLCVSTTGSATLAQGPRPSRQYQMRGTLGGPMHCGCHVSCCYLACNSQRLQTAYHCGTSCSAAQKQGEVTPWNQQGKGVSATIVRVGTEAIMQHLALAVVWK